MLMYYYKNSASREGSHTVVEPQSHKPAENTVQTCDLWSYAMHLSAFAESLKVHYYTLRDVLWVNTDQ